MTRLIFILSIAIIITGCNQKNTDSKTFTLNDSPEIKDAITEVENSLIPTLLIEGDTSMAKGFNILDRMDYFKIPGLSIALINNGQIEWAKTYGFKTAKKASPINLNTQFQAASISKPVTAVCALSMVEENQLSLTNNINDYLTSWKISENEFTETEHINITRILSHTAGLSTPGFDGYEIEEAIPSLEQILNGEHPANSAGVTVFTTPGSQWRYSGGGYTVLQQAMIDVSGNNFNTLLSNKILNPLKMEHSTFDYPNSKDPNLNISYGHYRTGETVKGGYHLYPELAAAGLWTTSSDLAKFIIEVMKSYTGSSNKILSEEMAENMLSGGNMGFGLGFSVYGTGDSIIVGHSGSNYGYQCNMIAYPHRGYGVVIMTNSFNGHDIISEIKRSISKVYDWPHYKPRYKATTDIPIKNIKDITGSYLYEADSLWFEVTVDNGKLILYDPENMTFDLFHEDSLRFFNTGADNFNFIYNEESKQYELFAKKATASRGVTAIKINK